MFEEIFFKKIMSSEIAQILFEMFSLPFLARAFLVGTLVSLCASLLGLSLVLKRFSMIGDGLSHVGFGSLAVAAALNAAPLLVSIPIVILAAFILLRLSENSKIKGDAAIALFSTSSLAIGVVIVALTTGMNTDICNYLFGSILSTTTQDVQLGVPLSIAVIILYIFFYHKIFAITFDENFAKAAGVKTGVYTMLIAFFTALVIVLGMRMMGAMLISSLIIFPALTSMRIFKKFRSVTICSVVVALVCFFVGIITSYLYISSTGKSLPAGASVVLMNIIAFFIFWGLSLLLKLKWFGKGIVKKAALVSIVCVLFLVGCIRDDAGDNRNATRDERSLANTVVEIREAFFITMLNEIYLYPKDYLGKTIKLEGLFRYEQGYERDYCYVMRYGPGCCGFDGIAAMEISWNEPDQIVNQNLQLDLYPKEDDWVEAKGVLKSYNENDFNYLYLVLSDLIILNDRGLEFVTQ